jgi:hypothetical protein
MISKRWILKLWSSGFTLKMEVDVPLTRDNMHQPFYTVSHSRRPQSEEYKRLTLSFIRTTEMVYWSLQWRHIVVSERYELNFKIVKREKKGNAVTVAALECPSGERSRLPHLDNRLTDGVKVVSLTRRPPFTSQEDSLYSFLLEAESTPGPYCGWKD